MQEDDSGQEKTEEPTQKRLDKAEEDGHTLRSQEFTIAFLLLGCLIVLINMGANFVSSLLSVYRFNLDLPRTAETGQMQDHVRYSLDLVAGDLLLFLLSSIVLALVSNLLLGGLKFNPGAAGFKLDRLNPLNGMKRIFSSHGLYELAKVSSRPLSFLVQPWPSSGTTWTSSFCWHFCRWTWLSTNREICSGLRFY